jgi:mannan endo-1,4-beta-mannosidase
LERENDRRPPSKPRRTGNKQWTAWLDLVADVCKGVAPTPVLFRPFHENYLRNWWGSPYCTPAEFKAGWQYTVDYLRNNQGATDRGVRGLT